MPTPSMESQLLVRTGNSLYTFDICTEMLKAAISSNCFGNAQKFHSLTRLIVELQLQYVLDDLDALECWTWAEIDQAEAAYAIFEKSAATKLSELVAGCKSDSKVEIRNHINEIQCFLGALPGLAYDKIKREVELKEPELLPKSSSPRPNDIA